MLELHGEVRLLDVFDPDGNRVQLVQESPAMIRPRRASRTSASSATCCATPTTGAGRGEPGREPVSRYVDGWGRPATRRVIALDEGFPVGAAWYRLFSSGEPGFGFVDEQTPELSIAVVPSRRGRGFGGELLDALLARASASGLRRRLSLSVDRGQPGDARSTSATASSKVERARRLVRRCAPSSVGRSRRSPSIGS